MTARHHEIDPHHLFWGVLDGSLVSRDAGVPRSEQLQALFESKLPVPLETVHCAFVGADADRVLAVAARHEDLHAIRSDAPWTTSAAPRCWPPPVVDTIAADALPVVSSINLLTGRHEPVAVRRVRRHATGWVAAAAAVIAGLTILGGEWRRAATLGQLAAISTARERVLDHALPAVASSARNPQPPELRLQVALRQLAQTREAPGRDDAARPARGAPPPDVLSSVLAAWPSDVEIRLQSLELVEDRLTVTVEAKDAETLQKLLVTLDMVDHLHAEPLQGGPRSSGYGGTLAFRVTRIVEQPVPGGSS